MNTKISNQILQIEIASKGAELQSIINNKTGLEYLWDADPAFWSKKSPVLFPIVGGLKNNTYNYNNKSYQLSRHGFARDSFFELTAQTENSVTYTLNSSEATLKNYPFYFSFAVTYTIEENKLICTYTVKNTDDKTMFFSCGAHPAFKVPLTGNTDFTDWYLQFAVNENAGIWPLSAEGLILKEAIPCLNNTNQLALSKPLFYKDALVFKNLQSTTIGIISSKSKHGLTMQFDGFPFYGIWSTQDADFVCLEPWYGIADSVDSSGELQDKEGIQNLIPQAVWERSWSVVLF
jgi:galactose mutarotase-like enzyme